MGVFNANSVVSDVQWSADGWSGWSVGRHGYLPEDVFGYAFAVYAWKRREHNPDWAKYLRPNVRHVFKKGLRYLEHAGSESFAAGNAIKVKDLVYPGKRMHC
ncbi:MAG: hypothetical protein ACE37H_00195 [Phycisphaeraceae bacterium]